MPTFILVVTHAEGHAPASSYARVTNEIREATSGNNGRKLAVEVLTDATHDGTYLLWFEAPSLRIARKLANRYDGDISLWELGDHAMRPIEQKHDTDDQVTEAGRESFPASDPPAFTSETGAGKPR